jgi:hypothetical protein
MGLGKPHETIQHARENLAENMFCALSANKVNGLFSFAEQAITGTVYLDMMTLWLCHSLKKAVVARSSFNKMVHHTVLTAI